MALLLEQLDQDPIRTKDLLLRAYKWLSMPQMRVKCFHGTCRPTMRGSLLAADAIKVNVIEETPGFVTHPYRAFANTVINFIYRLGPIENFHAGFGATFSLKYRRFTSDQIKTLMQFSAERVGEVLDICKVGNDTLPLWPQRVSWLIPTDFYPRTWSLTEASSPVHIPKVARQLPLAFS